MEGEYDCIIMGTGLTECILSGLLSMEGKTVLHLDKNDYYGGDCSSLSFDQAVGLFGAPEDPSLFGRSRDWNIDLVPKFLMCQGQMISILLHCGVSRYLEFRAVDSSYVVQGKKLHAIPASESEALRSSLLGLFEKYRFKDFLIFISDYQEDAPAGKFDLNTITARGLMQHYKLDKDTMSFVGHAMALYREDNYLDKPALEFVQRVKLYINSLYHAVGVYNGHSPYLYPMYGVGDLPQAFARLSSVYGGTYMLNQPVDTILKDENGTAIGIVSNGRTAKCTSIIASPSYFPELVKVTGKSVRAICILDHPIAAIKNVESSQIIIPQSQLKRKSDVYINLISSTHAVCPKGKYIAIASANVETENPESELEPALAFLRPILVSWYSIIDIYEPANNHELDRIHITRSYDATPHFETVVSDVLRIYKQIAKKDFDFSKIVIPQENE